MLVSTAPNLIPEGSTCALGRHPHTDLNSVIVDIGNFEFIMIFLTLFNFYFNGPLVSFSRAEDLHLTTNV